MPGADADVVLAAAEAEGRRLAPPVAVGALGTGAVGAVLVAGAPAGAALSLCAELSLATRAVASNRWRRDRWAGAMLFAAALLALAPLFRDGGWVVAGDLVVCFGLAAIALSAARTTFAVLAAPADLFGRMLVGPAAALRGALGFASGSTATAIAPAARAAALAAALVLVFGALFASADGAFAQLAGELIPQPPDLGSLPTRIAIGLAALSAAAGLALMFRRDAAATAPAGRGFSPIEWGAGLACVLVLFAGFVAVQFVVLFGGRAHVLDTAGLTYAEYARQGFAQLLIVAALALGLIAVARRWARIEASRHELALRLLLVAIAVLTLVIVVSALHRLDLYVDEFGATRLRLGAAAACAWIGALLVAAIAAASSGRSSWMARFVVSSVAIASIGFTIADPDSLIARRNVDRFFETGRIDVAYNSSLSADAVGQLARLPQPVGERVLVDEHVRLSGRDGVRGFNLARASARETLGIAAP